MEQDGSRPRRPAPYPDLTAFIDAAGGWLMDPAGDVAGSTAAAVLQAGRAGESADRFVALADTVGLETLAALWREADPVSLPGALWALYLLRQWCRIGGDEVVLLWRSGQPFAEPDSVVTGLDEYADEDKVRAFADDLLTGAYLGDFGVALDRAAAFFRVVAKGRRERGTDDDLAERNVKASVDLALAAARWRAGTLR